MLSNNQLPSIQGLDDEPLLGAAVLEHKETKEAGENTGEEKEGIREVVVEPTLQENLAAVAAANTALDAVFRTSRARAGIAFWSFVTIAGLCGGTAFALLAAKLAANDDTDDPEARLFKVMAVLSYFMGVVGAHPLFFYCFPSACKRYSRMAGDEIAEAVRSAPGYHAFENNARSLLFNPEQENSLLSERPNPFLMGRQLKKLEQDIEDAIKQRDNHHVGLLSCTRVNSYSKQLGINRFFRQLGPVGKTTAAGAIVTKILEYAGPKR